jgi:hypothetical protein
MTAESDDPPALTETPPQQPRSSAQEGSTAVSAVKDTRAATSSISKPRLASRSHPAAHRHLIDIHQILICARNREFN